ncbi:MAG: DUF4926 domain-containing protein [Dehalococcoidia bacterium]
MKEFDPVILTEDLLDQTITDDVLSKGVVAAGTVGYIVHVYGKGEAFIVEFFDKGETIAVADVRADQVRAATEQDLAARRMSA